MFFVSDEVKEVTGEVKIGVTDSYDSVKEYYTNREIVSFVRKKKINIYGVSIYNDYATCTEITLNTSIEKSKLVKLLEEYKKVHNNWNKLPIDDYLASAVVGTKIVISYKNRGSDGHIYKGETKVEKVGVDKWKYIDDNNTFSGEIGDSRFASWALEVAYIFATPVSIRITEG